MSIKKTKANKKKWLIFTRNKTSVIGAVLAIIIILIAIFAPVIATFDPLKQDIFNALSPMSRIHLFGTDDYGRDIFSRIIWGSRISILIGITSVLFGMAIGTCIGITAGYFGGKIESILMRFTDIMMSFPDLILAIIISAVLGPSMINIIITIGIARTPGFARLVHGIVLSIKEREYVEAAKSLGASNGRIMFMHILPNFIGQLLVAGTLWIGDAIRLEANLAFVGLGVPPPFPTWGGIARDGINLLMNSPWISLFAGLSIFITILSFNMFCDGLRDIIDPKLRGSM